MLASGLQGGRCSLPRDFVRQLNSSFTTTLGRFYSTRFVSVLARTPFPQECLGYEYDEIVEEHGLEQGESFLAETIEERPNANCMHVRFLALCTSGE